MSRINLIAALARNGTIGRDGQIPWHLPGEQAYFRKVTLGHPIVMGRKTWESIGKPLPGRRNIVVTRTNSAAPGAEVAGSLQDALIRVADVPEVFVIGGAQLYAEGLRHAHRLLLTEIDADIAGDTFFPAFDRSAWRETRREAVAAADGRPSYAFVIYER